ncbi:MAG: ABC transporter permease [Balneolaceae bacterium]|nr:ABC transporter permease [Balneolaceae bacterium]MBO6545348.1 ABC transporter permease [Balneolaceae bacterium]MBO6646744.1 ABC transporter permease [Balneolaceae bacterium]
MKTGNKNSPPKLAKWILSISVAWKFKEEAEADLDELFQIRLSNHGAAYARRQYWKDVLSIWTRRSWFEEFQFTNLNTYSMFKNYMKVTFRSLKKQKVYSFINVFGLAIGLAFCALIFLYVQDELTYDRFHENSDRVFRVEQRYFEANGSVRYDGANGPIPLAPTLKQEIPGVEAYTRERRLFHYVKSDNEAIREVVHYADEDLFKIFSFPFISGDPETALSNTNSAVITEEIAFKYFGKINAVGESIKIRKEESFEDFLITGVVGSYPENSTFRFNILLSIRGEAYYRPPYIDRWNMNLYRTFIMLEEQVDADQLKQPLADFRERYVGEHNQILRERYKIPEDQLASTYHLNPLPEIHLNSVSDPLYSYILSGIAIAILLIACINFMTLSIGRSSKRSKEVGMRKVVGAFRHQLMFQFWGEAFLICGISMILGILLAEGFLPVFNSLSGKTLAFNYLENWSTLVVLFGFLVITGFVAGSYPAVILSSFKPVTTLKGSLKLSGSNFFTKSLVSLQFALSVMLIISTLVMKNQLQFIRSQDLGYNTEHVVYIPLNRLDGLEVANDFRTAIGGHTDIVDITATGVAVGFQGSYGYGKEYNGEVKYINVFTVESNYIDFMGMELIAGRNFNPNLATDSTESVIITETFAREFGLDDPIGKQIPALTPGEDDHGGAIIVGMVKDHYFQSLYDEMDPAFLTMNSAWGHGNLLIRISPENIQETIAMIEDTWKTFVPEIPLNYRFLEEDMYEEYANDERWSTIINYSSLFAIFIACLGLFGLVTLTVSSRIKEVGIRKVLGASVLQISGLFAKDFIKLIAIGVLIASPIAWYAMNEWLMNFAYHISIGPMHFVLATLLILFIAMATISFQTIKAGLTNPAETLSNE